MAADLEWLDVMHSRGYGSLSAPQAETDKKATATTYTSTVRLAVAVKKMAATQTLPALAAIKDAAKPTLLPRDLPRLKEAFQLRQQYLRSIPTTPIENEGAL